MMADTKTVATLRRVFTTCAWCFYEKRDMEPVIADDGEPELVCAACRHEARIRLLTEQDHGAVARERFADFCDTLQYGYERQLDPKPPRGGKEFS